MKTSQKILLILVVFLSFVCAALFLDENRVSRKRAFAENTLPFRLQQDGTIPDKFRLLFIGSDNELRVGRYLYLINSTSNDKEIWEKHGWFPSKNVPDNLFLKSKVEMFCDSPQNYDILMKKDSTSYLLFEQKIAITKSFSFLLIVFP